MKKVLVTGADGFIGSHVTEAVLSAGYSVKAFCQYNSFGSRGWLDQMELSKDVEFLLGDIRDAGFVRSSVSDCDAVLHLAALIAIPYSYHAPEAYIDTNVKGTLNVLNAARDAEIQKLIVTSTSEVYGTAQKVPIPEDHPLEAQSPYAASKTAADQLALSFYRSFATPVTVLRPFNAYGPRQSARAFIPAVISQVVQKKEKISLGSLHPTRDLTFVKDTADGFVAALKATGTEGQVINLASNFEISMGEVAKMVIKLTGSSAKIVEDTSRIRPDASEVLRLFGDDKKAKSLLGWSAKHGGLAGFEKGLAQTIEWFMQPKNQVFYRDRGYVI